MENTTKSDFDINKYKLIDKAEFKDDDNNESAGGVIVSVYSYNDQLDAIKSRILRCFSQISEIWTEELLWNAVRTPIKGWNTYWNPETYDKSVFHDALSQLIYEPNT